MWRLAPLRKRPTTIPQDEKRLIQFDFASAGINTTFMGQHQHQHQHSRSSWGEDADTVRADRFLGEDGQVDTTRVKELMAFGLPTVLMCPGRYVVFNVVMLNLIKTLLTFDIAAAPGETLNDGQGACKPKKSMVAGVPEPSQDPKLVLSRRKDVESVHVTFENQKPGW
ncbi:hypothetical protein NQ176_g5685 [Zarea fungicola]|uniref:Uncharacterized protein n=1 Tax=Zarea fungicola TaxID=93591 RepID=A0ACC1N9L3_9HYPO|nr:hypothetical protein NQ176_g5685 [Lecanicillium fungicola]